MKPELDVDPKELAGLDQLALTSRPGTCFFRWRAEWNLHVDFMDEDHRMLVFIINDIATGFACKHECEQQPRVLRGKYLTHSLIELEMHTRSHFEREEAFMREIGYPDLPRHKREHDLMLAEYTELLREARLKNATFLDVAALEAIKGWLLGHLLDDDRELVRFVRASARRQGRRRGNA